jgi:hypothetical protein
MKKFLAAAVVTGLIGGSAFAATNVVSSANVVGYVKVQVPASSFTMIANPFINSSQADMTISEIFGTSMADGSELYIFNNGYTTYTYIDGIGWLDEDSNDAGSVVIARGRGFWIKNVTASPVEITLAGDVPGNVFQSATNTLQAGFAMASSSYPVDKTLATLGMTPADGDEIYIYSNGYTTYTYIDGIGWLDENSEAADAVVINVGHGFWYKTGAANTWVEVKPYANF